MNLSDDLWLGLTNSVPSLIRIVVGVAVAFVLGLTLAFLRYRLPEKIRDHFLVNFLLEAPRYPPPIAWIPFVILMAGIGEFSAIIIVVIGAFFPIFTNTYSGMKRIPRAIIWTARSLELSGLEFFRTILIPAALPEILTGLRIGLGMGWMSVIASEMVGGQSGLGYAIQLDRLNMQYSAMTVDIGFIGVIGFLLSLIMNQIERRCLNYLDVAYSIKGFG